MAAAGGMPRVGIIPKVALVSARLAEKPFEIPKQVTNASVVTGGAVNNVVGKSSEALGQSLEALRPRGPAKLGAHLLDAVVASAESSIKRGDVNTQVFWKPFSLASLQMGQAVANPGALMYARKAGFPVGFDTPENTQSTMELLARLVHREKGDPRFPVYTPPAPAPAPAPAPPTTPPSSAQPDTPPAPGAPKPPDTPATPDAPKPPDTPATPDAPKPPDTPATPDAPKQPDTPATPDAPKPPDTPATPNAPKPPDGPAKPDAPKAPDTPATPDAPKQPDSSQPAPH